MVEAPLRLLCISDANLAEAELDGWNIQVYPAELSGVRGLTWPRENFKGDVDALILTLSDLRKVHWRDLQYFRRVDAVVFIYESTQDWREWLPVVQSTSCDLPVLVLRAPVTEAQLQLGSKLKHESVNGNGHRIYCVCQNSQSLIPLVLSCPCPASVGPELCLPSLIRVHLEQSALGQHAASVFARPEPSHQGDFLYRVAEPFIADGARDLVDRAVAERAISSSSAWPFRLQDELQKFYGSAAVQACSNGHDALVLALRALDLGPGDEVLVPAWTFVAVMNAVVAIGATPIMADAAPGEYNPGRKEWMAAASFRTRALIVSYTMGLVCNVDELNTLCRENCWYLIEDISEAVGSRWRGRLVGTFGEVAACSLFANKLVTAGDGGFVLTRLKHLEARLAAFTAHGGNFGGGQWRFVHPELGYNCKMAGLSAALAIAAIPEIDRLAQHRREIAKWYATALQDVVAVMPWRPNDKDAYDVPWLVGIHVDTVQTRDDLRRFLAKKKIETRSYFLPLHLQPSYELLLAKQLKARVPETLPKAPIPVIPQLPQAECLGATGLNLPTHAYLTEADVGYIAACVREFFELAESLPQQPKQVLTPFFSFDETTRVTCSRNVSTQTDSGSALRTRSAE